MNPERRAELLMIIADVESGRKDLRHETEFSYQLITLARALKEMLEGTGETVAIEQVGGDRLREKARE